MPEIVWCYVERRGSVWEGVCLDFDLAVQGQSFREVQDRLGTAIHEYLEYVKNLPAPEQARFLERRVPFLVRLQFALRSFIAALLIRGRGKDAGHMSYTVACPA